MNQSKYRLLVVATHPIQYRVPLFRLMAEHPKLEILVAYCSLHGAEPGMDSEFGIEVAWDIPLLDGYPWVSMPNRANQPGLGSFFGLTNPGLWTLIHTGHFDAVIIYSGYVYASFWIALAAAKFSKTAAILSTDAYEIETRNHQSWKTYIKKQLWPLIFGLGDSVTVFSSAGVKLMHSLGLSPKKVHLTPNVVNNSWWVQQSTLSNRSIVRQQWNIPEAAPVALFCGKLQPWKRPQDVLQAFAQANVSSAYLIIVGEGPLRPLLEAEVQNLKLSQTVKFLGFINQSQLPSVYSACDLMVCSSEYEPFGLVVNEAMLCRCPVVVSDRVGACSDIVDHGKTGWIYPCGQVDALAAILQKILLQQEDLKSKVEAAFKRMETWSPRDNVEGLIHAVEVAVKANRSM